MGLHIDPFGENKQKEVEIEKKVIEEPVKQSNNLNELDLLDIDTLLNMNEKEI